MLNDLEKLENISNKETLAKIEEDILKRPKLENLSKEQLEAVANYVLLNKYADDLEKKLAYSKFDYQEYKNKFLVDVVKKVNTRLAYTNAFVYFEEFLSKENISSPFSLSFEEADGFINFLKSKMFSSLSIRQMTVAISSFYSYMSRISEGLIRNTFLGSREIPKRKVNLDGRFYKTRVTDELIQKVSDEFEFIYSTIKGPILKAEVGIMIDLGLRVGSFTSYFSFDGLGNFKTISKSKPISGKLTERNMNDISLARLEREHTFKMDNANKIKNAYKYYTKMLYSQAEISYIYSCHDMRHLFAIKAYRKTRDIFYVSKLLNHSSVIITQEYLRGLNEDVKELKNCNFKQENYE